MYKRQHPDATAALQCLKSPVLDQLRRRIYGPEPITPSPKTEQVLRHDRNARKVAAKVVLMATDAVQHLTRAGKDIDAEWVGNLLLEKFGDLLRGELVRALPDLHLLEPVTVQG